MVNERLVTMNKKGFLPRTWVVSTILFVTIIALFYIASSGFLTEYGEEGQIDSSFNENYNKYDDIIDQEGESFADIFESMSDGKGFDVLDAIIGLPKVFLKVIKLTFASVGSMSGIADDFGESFGIPEEIANILFGAIIMLVSVILIFAIISSASKSNRI